MLSTRGSSPIWHATAYYRRILNYRIATNAIRSELNSMTQRNSVAASTL